MTNPITIHSEKQYIWDERSKRYKKSEAERTHPNAWATDTVYEMDLHQIIHALHKKIERLERKN